MNQRRLILALFAALLVCLLLLGAATGWIIARGLGPDGRPAIANTATVVRQIQGLNQLVTVKYVLEKVVLVEDTKWFGENRLLMVAHGNAKAGVDLSQLRPGDVEVRGTRVSITLPPPQLVDVYLDDRQTRVIERTTGLLREFDKDLEQDARRQAVDQIRLAARDAGILPDAAGRARLQLTEFLRQLGFTEVDVRTR